MIFLSSSLAPSIRFFSSTWLFSSHLRVWVFVFQRFVGVRVCALLLYCCWFVFVHFRYEFVVTVLYGFKITTVITHTTKRLFYEKVFRNAKCARAHSTNEMSRSLPLTSVCWWLFMLFFFYYFSLALSISFTYPYIFAVNCCKFVCPVTYNDGSTNISRYIPKFKQKTHTNIYVKKNASWTQLF